MRDPAGLAILGVLLFVGIPLYFLPSIVAYQRGHRNAEGVLLVNLLLGWCLVGWAIAIVWATYQSADDVKAKAKLSRKRVAGPSPFDEPAPPPPPPAPAPIPLPAVVTYTCPHCRYPVAVPSTMIGHPITCGTCRYPFGT